MQTPDVEYYRECVHLAVQRVLDDRAMGVRPSFSLGVLSGLVTAAFVIDGTTGSPLYLWASEQYELARGDDDATA